MSENLHGFEHSLKIVTQVDIKKINTKTQDSLYKISPVSGGLTKLTSQYICGVAIVTLKQVGIK